MTITRSVGAAGTIIAPKAVRERETPLDPEEAPAPQKTRRVTITPDNMIMQWNRVAEAVSGESLRVGVALAHGKPVALDGAEIVVCFPDDQANFMALVNQPDNQRLVCATLRNLTANIESWRTGVSPEIVDSEPRDEPRRAPISGGHVSSEEAQAALENPHVAKVVELFRGRIVDVKHRAGAE
jgi:hypothetical protein